MHYRTRLLLRRIFLAAFVVLLVAMAIVMHVPLRAPLESIRRLGIPHFDKIVHFSSYLLLSGTLTAWLWVGRVPVIKQMLLVIILLMLYSALEEWSQQFSIGRTSDVRDWYADVLGFTLGCVSMWSLFRWGPSWLRLTEQPTAAIAP